MNGQFWNQTPGSVTGATQQGGQQQQEPSPAEQQIEALVDRRLEAKRAAAQDDYYRRQSKLNELGAKFMEDEARKPWFPMANAHFNALQAANPTVPMDQHYDETLKYIEDMKRIGVKPPEQSQQQFTGIPSHTQQYAGGVPILGDPKYRSDENGLQRPGHLTDEAKEENARQYIEARRRDLENCKSRGEAGESMKEYYAGRSQLESTSA